jgi:DNA-directed RNA polymerase subunit RPC12/RpoP
MPTLELKIACQRCGEQMEMKDPGPGDAWRPDQFWVCARCGRHFWSTYPAPASAAASTPAALATPAVATAAPAAVPKS